MDDEVTAVVMLVAAVEGGITISCDHYFPNAGRLRSERNTSAGIFPAHGRGGGLCEPS